MAELANGTGLYWGTDGTTYTEAADLAGMSAPGSPSYSDIDVTPLKPTDDTRSFERGLRDSGEFSFRQYWSKTRLDGWRDAEDAGANLYWRVTYPDDTTPTTASKTEFRGYIKSVQEPTFDDPETPLIITVTVKVTSRPVFTPKA